MENTSLLLAEVTARLTCIVCKHSNEVAGVQHGRHPLRHLYVAVGMSVCA